MSELKGFKFVKTLVLEIKKIEIDHKTKYDTFCSNLKAEAIINESDIADVFESVYIIIILNIQKSLGKSLDWVIDSTVGHNINISTHNPLVGSRYTKLPKELDYPRKDLINIQIVDGNVCW